MRKEIIMYNGKNLARVSKTKALNAILTRLIPIMGLLNLALLKNTMNLIAFLLS